jgi:hypothetical protein
MTPITVYVNDAPMALMTGAEAWMAIERLPLETRFAIETGQAFLADGLGNEVGSGGGLADGQRLYVVWRA